MTYNLGGEKIKKQKFIDVGINIFNIPLQIEEELCRQLNKGLWKDEIKDVEIIQRFIKRCKNVD